MLQGFQIFGNMTSRRGAYSIQYSYTAVDSIHTEDCWLYSSHILCLGPTGTSIDILSWTTQSSEAQQIRRALSQIYDPQLIRLHSLRDLVPTNGKTLLN